MFLWATKDGKGGCDLVFFSCSVEESLGHVVNIMSVEVQIEMDLDVVEDSSKRPWIREKSRL